MKDSCQDHVYDAGTILLTQYCDIAQTWSNLWQDRPQDESAGDIQVQQMKHLQAMVTRIEQMIRDLPDAKYARAQVHDRGPLMTGQGAQAGGTRDICRQFRRTGKCSYGDKCKFEHQANPGIVLMVNPIQENRIEQLQDTLMELPGIGDTRYYDDPVTDVQFHQIYERAKQDADEGDFDAGYAPAGCYGGRQPDLWASRTQHGSVEGAEPEGRLFITRHIGLGDNTH